jgi:hypothetical protein
MRRCRAKELAEEWGRVLKIGESKERRDLGRLCLPLLSDEVTPETSEIVAPVAQSDHTVSLIAQHI